LLRPADAMPSLPPAARKLLERLRRMTPVFVVLLFLVLAVRYIWRDTVSWAAPTYYALPLPLHVAAWLALAVLHRGLSRRRAAVFLIAAGLLGLLWKLNTERLCRDIAVLDNAGPRVLLWNIGHTAKVPAALHELIAELEPDAVVLAEAENLGASGQAELRQRHAGFRMLECADGVACLVRGTIGLLKSEQLADRVHVDVLTASFARIPGEWRLCVTDIPPLPPLPRTKYLDAIRAIAGTGPRTLIAADFNTPLDSAAFDAWRGQYHHGLADCAAWHGPLETWGYGVPVLAIDHIWMSRDLAPASARMEARLASDHSWVFVECGTAK